VAYTYTHLRCVAVINALNWQFLCKRVEIFTPHPTPPTPPKVAVINRKYAAGVPAPILRGRGLRFYGSCMNLPGFICGLHDLDSYGPQPEPFVGLIKRYFGSHITGVSSTANGHYLFNTGNDLFYYSETLWRCSEITLQKVNKNPRNNTEILCKS